MTGQDFTGMSGLVTGGASGIGEAIARGFVEAGGRIVIADIDDARGEKLSEDLGAGATYVHADVTSEPDVARALGTTVGAYGAVDCFYSNAGVLGPIESISKTSLEEWNRVNAILV